ncbi:hypothetical protein REPUB_Repub08aG0195700 [Reevesia pubescens]
MRDSFDTLDIIRSSSKGNDYVIDALQSPKSKFNSSNRFEILSHGDTSPTNAELVIQVESSVQNLVNVDLEGKEMLNLALLVVNSNVGNDDVITEAAYISPKKVGAAAVKVLEVVKTLIPLRKGIAGKGKRKKNKKSNASCSS